MLRTLTIPLLLSISLTAHAQIKNDFDLSDSLIDASRIRSGGPPRDGIPSLDEPKFESIVDVDFLDSDDRVIGVYRNGVAKAYPIRILNWHEVVNDDFAGSATLVTYCPLCGTGMVFDVQNDEIEFTFGVSGLLYNSDVLLYDRQTGSLWSQIMSQAVTGPMKHTKLDLLPSRHTNWADWRELHPETLVLSTDTGYQRNYNSSPYLSYEQSSRLMFDVENRNRAYANKDLVLGLSIGERHRAYPLKELGKQGAERFNDELAEQQLTVVWSESANSAHVLDRSGTEIPTVLAYWFAWYAFHPQTEIFRADE
jgi:hypothetical protein